MVAIQVIAVAMTFFSLALVTTIRDDLVTSWQAKVPENAPNVFAINLLEKETQRFQAFLDQYKINHSPLYPIIRGRLSAVNQILINEYTSAESGLNDESLERDLALTWSRDLPENNKILNGEWHKVDEQINRVSVEEGIAENLEIEIGDTLTFTVEAEKISAVVTSIRSVEWESFMPNFYMIFSRLISQTDNGKNLETVINQIILEAQKAKNVMLFIDEARAQRRAGLRPGRSAA